MDIKVMSFNMRVPSDKDGKNHFTNRESNILSVIQSEDADLIGFQEATDYSRKFLRDNISGKYTVIGCGRESNFRGESCCIAFKNDKFELVKYETKFLSHTPDVSGSIYSGTDQSRCPRLYIHAELACEDGKIIHFYNTHLDHIGATARFLGMTQIMQSVSECVGRFVLTGDMNALPDSPEIRLPLLCKQKRIVDVTAGIENTFHSYGRKTSNHKIDYIFTDAECKNAYAVEDSHENGIYISDHYPICSILKI